MNDKTLIAIAAVLVGTAFLSRRASAAAAGTDDDLLKEITITAKRIGEGGLTLTDLLGGSTLGLRNNNPMNVRETGITWQGELPHDGDGYENFETAADGIRAGSRVLFNYWRIHKLNSIRGVITRWAPKADANPTDSYIAFVSDRMATNADVSLDMDSIDVVTSLAMAIIEFENGKNPFTRGFVRDAVKRAV